jgi:DMSO/TMAO reductase YedYZ heme-binding membrane subunit
LSAIDLCADVGLVAMFLATVNICLGLLIAVRYSPVRYWPRRRLNVFAFHNWTGYGVLVATLVHPVILLFSSQVRFRVLDIVFPVWSPKQPLENTLGAVALYALAIVVVTSYARIKIGRRLWKLLHFLVYPAAALLFVHGLLTDPTLNGTAIDYFDGEKVFVEGCLLVVVVASLWAMQYRRAKDRRERELRVGRYYDVEPAAAD